VQYSAVQCSTGSELVGGDLVESSTAGSQLVRLRNCGDSQRGLEAMYTKVEGSKASQTITRRLMKIRQAEKT
jgi:hypothetical protein